MRKLSFIVAFSLATFGLLSFFSCTSQAPSPKANLKTDVDSLSYAFGVGIVHAQGLAQYVEQQVDSAYLNEFIKGFNAGYKLDKDDKKASAYTFGLQIGQQVGTQMIPGINQNFFSSDTTQAISKNNLAAGLITALLNKQLLIDKDSVEPYIENFQKTFFAKQHATEKEANAKFLEENKTQEGVIALPSGLQYKVVTEGRGAKPTAESTVKVAYKGTLIDGTEFDSNEEIEFSLQGVIRGWTEGIQLMSVGSKYIFYIPYDLAYGEQGDGRSIPPYAALVFEVTLKGIAAQ